MKKVFGAIGGFFKRIWRWIAETAWIQPLLIVGLIFGVIFSIPSISSWIANAAATSGQFAFYKRHTVEVSKLLNDFDNGNYEKYYKDEETKNFLLVFIEEDCDQCINDEEAFKLFCENKSYWEGNVAPAVYFVYANYDEDDNNQKQADAWKEFTEKYNLFDTVEDVYKETCDAYTIDEVEDYIKPHEEGKISTPLITYYEEDKMTEAIMGLDASRNTDKALYLHDFYYHMNDFEN